MSSVVISVVVVGACIVAGCWIAFASGTMHERRRPPQGATKPAEGGRGDLATGAPAPAAPRVGAARTAPVLGRHRTPWHVRLRAGLALGCLSIILGAAAAAAFCLVVVGAFLLLRSSL